MESYVYGFSVALVSKSEAVRGQQKFGFLLLPQITSLFTQPDHMKAMLLFGCDSQSFCHLSAPTGEAHPNVWNFGNCFYLYCFESPVCVYVCSAGSCVS